MMDVDEAKEKWEADNNVQEVEDIYYKFDKEKFYKTRSEKPWKQDPIYFKNVRISAVALIKMTMHAVSGGTNEIMGLMQGTIDGDTMYVSDAYPLPVVGVEYQVNPGAQCDVYMTDFNEANLAVGKDSPCIGWYHSHPGLEVFLSGIDCSTQSLYQNYSDPWLAIVIDPHRTMTQGSIELGCFRVYPEGYTPPANSVSKFRIPPDRVKDFGTHCNRFYPLDYSVYKSSTDARMFDLLWSKYWVKTLSSSPLIVARDYISKKMENLNTKLAIVESGLGSGRHGMALSADKQKQNPFADVCEESSEAADETVHSMISQVIKDSLFNFV